MPTQFPVPPIFKRTSDSRSICPAQEPTAAFRACHERFAACLEYKSLRSNSPMNKTIDSYLLDFDLAAKRAFGSDSAKYRLFRLHFVEGHSANDVCGQLGLSRFAFASEIAKIQKLAGQSFVERGLFPLASYFSEAESMKQERRAA